MSLKVYKIYGIIYLLLAYGRYFEIPFGKAIGGNYTIEFYVEAVQNVNIHVMIEKGPKCLYDKLDWNDIDKIIFYES